VQAVVGLSGGLGVDVVLEAARSHTVPVADVLAVLAAHGAWLTLDHHLQVCLSARASASVSVFALCLCLRCV
jgi:hypothetical protein